jgi:hypothetical protein
MARRGSARADALRRAHAAKAARDAARQLREAQIESALADYYQAASLAERIRDTGRRKAAELAAETERSADPQDAAAAEAIRRLRDLLGGVTETAELCRLTPSAVRDLLSGSPGAREPRKAGTGGVPSPTDGNRHDQREMP